MSFLTPHFWYPAPSNRAGVCPVLLTPLSWIYGVGHRLAFRSKAPYKAAIPVFCVGNIVAGGAGKTPTAIALLQLLKTHGIADSPYFLTRGHGGRLKNAVLVDPSAHNAFMVGDEALLLARVAPVVRAAKRGLGAVIAWQDGADAVVMDDGFQNPSLHKDIGLIVIDGAIGFGNGKMIPAGPLREPVSAALSRAQGVILIGEDRHNVRAHIPDGLPVFEASIAPTNAPKAKKYIGFCGLGRPEKFFTTLRDMECDMVEEHSYPDHYSYRQDDIDYLRQRAKAAGARLITTEKDAVKFAGLSGVEEIETLGIALRWRDESAVVAFLKDALS